MGTLFLNSKFLALNIWINKKIDIRSILIKETACPTIIEIGIIEKRKIIKLFSAFLLI